jgi:hypothetical protein
MLQLTGTLETKGALTKTQGDNSTTGKRNKIIVISPLYKDPVKQSDFSNSAIQCILQGFKGMDWGWMDEQIRPIILSFK